MEWDADMRACGHVVWRQNACYRFVKRFFGMCFIKKKESLGHRVEDASMCDEHADCNAEINVGCQRESRINKRLEAKPPKMSIGSDKWQAVGKLSH